MSTWIVFARAGTTLATVATRRKSAVKIIETCEDQGDPLNQALDVSQGDRRLRAPPVHVIKNVSLGHSRRLDIRRVS